MIRINAKIKIALYLLGIFAIFVVVAVSGGAPLDKSLGAAGVGTVFVILWALIETFFPGFLSGHSRKRL